MSREKADRSQDNPSSSSMHQQPYNSFFALLLAALALFERVLALLLASLAFVLILSAASAFHCLLLWSASLEYSLALELAVEE